MYCKTVNAFITQLRKNRFAKHTAKKGSPFTFLPETPINTGTARVNPASWGFTSLHQGSPYGVLLGIYDDRLGSSMMAMRSRLLRPIAVAYSGLARMWRWRLGEVSLSDIFSLTIVLQLVIHKRWRVKPFRMNSFFRLLIKCDTRELFVCLGRKTALIEGTMLF